MSENIPELTMPSKSMAEALKVTVLFILFSTAQKSHTYKNLFRSGSADFTFTYYHEMSAFEPSFMKPLKKSLKIKVSRMVHPQWAF